MKGGYLACRKLTLEGSRLIDQRIAYQAVTSERVSVNGPERICNWKPVDGAVWMTQGTRITGNLLFDNRDQDLFVEISHGPYLVDHNLLLSPTALLDSAQGGAYAHNLFGGAIRHPCLATPPRHAHALS